MDHAEVAPTGFMTASGGVLSEGYRFGRPGVSLGDGQTKAEEVPSPRWTRRRAAPAYAPIPDLYIPKISVFELRKKYVIIMQLHMSLDGHTTKSRKANFLTQRNFLRM